MAICPAPARALENHGVYGLVIAAMLVSETLMMQLDQTLTSVVAWTMIVIAMSAVGLVLATDAREPPPRVTPVASRSKRGARATKPEPRRAGGAGRRGLGRKPLPAPKS